MIDVFPLSKLEFEYRGMTGKEEDLLTNEKLVKSGRALNMLIKGCIESIDGKPITEQDIIKLKAPDRLYAMVRIRQASYGDVIEVEALCTNNRCKHRNYADVDISMLEVKTEDVKETDSIEIDGKKVTFGHLDGNGEARLLKVNKAEILSESMSARIIEIDGIHPNGVSKWIKDLPVAERLKLRKAMESIDCGIVTKVEVECEECETPITVRIEQAQGFFFPEM